MKRARLLVPVDESAMTRKAVELAITMSETTGYELYLFCVGNPKKYGKLEGKALKEQLDASMDDMEAILTDVLVRCSQDREVDFVRIGIIHKRFSVGDMETEVLKMAGNISCDLIVLGATAERDPDWAAGRFDIDAKTAANIVGKAPCSVFTVKAVDEIFVLL